MDVKIGVLERDISKLRKSAAQSLQSLAEWICIGRLMCFPPCPCHCFHVTRVWQPWKWDTGRKKGLNLDFVFQRKELTIPSLITYPPVLVNGKILPFSLYCGKSTVWCLVRSGFTMDSSQFATVSPLSQSLTIKNSADACLRGLVQEKLSVGLFNLFFHLSLKIPQIFKIQWFLTQMFVANMSLYPFNLKHVLRTLKSFLILYPSKNWKALTSTSIEQLWTDDSRSSWNLEWE